MESGQVIAKIVISRPGSDLRACAYATRGFERDPDKLFAAKTAQIGSPTWPRIVGQVSERAKYHLGRDQINSAGLSALVGRANRERANTSTHLCG